MCTSQRICCVTSPKLLIFYLKKNIFPLTNENTTAKENRQEKVNKQTTLLPLRPLAMGLKNSLFRGKVPFPAQAIFLMTFFFSPIWASHILNNRKAAIKKNILVKLLFRKTKNIIFVDMLPKLGGEGGVRWPDH